MSYPTAWKQTVIHRLEQITQRMERIDALLEPNTEGATQQREKHTAAPKTIHSGCRLYGSPGFVAGNRGVGKS